MQTFFPLNTPLFKQVYIKCTVFLPWSCLQRVKLFISLCAKFTVQMIPNPVSKRNILQLNFLESWVLAENALGNSILLQTHTVMQAKYEKP